MPHRRLELAPRIALALALIVGPAIVVTSSSGDVDPAHKVRYERLSSSGTRFYNYDGSTRTRRAADRDWPIDFIFYRGASISKVKDLMRDIELVVPGGSMYEGYRYSYGSPRRFDSDRGLKDVCDLSYNDEHIRAYASVGSDRFYDDRYGFFVVGSATRTMPTAAAIPIHSTSGTRSSWRSASSTSCATSTPSCGSPLTTSRSTTRRISASTRATLGTSGSTTAARPPSACRETVPVVLDKPVHYNLPRLAPARS